MLSSERARSPKKSFSEEVSSLRNDCGEAISFVKGRGRGGDDRLGLLHDAHGIGFAPEAQRLGRRAGKRQRSVLIVSGRDGIPGSIAGRERRGGSFCKAFRGQRYRSEGRTYGAEYGGEYALFVSKAYLILGGMHVHIHVMRRQIKEKHGLRVVPAGESALIDLAHGFHEQAVVYGAAVHIEEHAVGTRLGRAGI